MTENEARKKWCPMIRCSDKENAATNRRSDGTIYDTDKCIASACMMWRWRFSVADNEAGIKKGYCGLGGKP